MKLNMRFRIWPARKGALAGEMGRDGAPPTGALPGRCRGSPSLQLRTGELGVLPVHELDRVEDRRRGLSAEDRVSEEALDDLVVEDYRASTEEQLHAAQPDVGSVVGDLCLGCCACGSD